MSVHLVKAIEKIKKRLLEMAAIVEDQLVKSLGAFTDFDEARAKAVLERDRDIDQREIDIEEECLQILALYHPVAHDLRFVVAVMKMNQDLERIGDYAVNIAERAITLSSLPERDLPVDYLPMATKVRQMLRGVIDALVNQDVPLATKIWKSDREIDALHKQNFAVIERKIQENPGATGRFINVLSISRYLERVADLAVNISEDVVYLEEGRIIRHQKRA